MPQNNLVPNWQAPLVDLRTGLVSQSWFSFFVRLTAQPPPIVGVVLTGSPFTYTASQAGQLAISGGTVSLVTIARARMTGIGTGLTNGLVTLAQGDSVTITYSVAPTLNFIPS